MAPFAVVVLGLYRKVKKPFGWGIRQVYGGLIIESNIALRKLGGEIYDAAPTIKAMGREPEFEVKSNDDFFRTSQCITLILGSFGRSNFLGMLVDTLWASVSMTVVISMRGKVAPAVAIAIFNQLEVRCRQLLHRFCSIPFTPSSVYCSDNSRHCDISYCWCLAFGGVSRRSSMRW